SYDQDESVRITAPGDLDARLPGRPARAVLEGILHDRLKDQAGHFNIERIGVDLQFCAQAALKTNFHDVDVVLQEAQLLPQRHRRRLSTVDGVPQQVAE